MELFEKSLLRLDPGQARELVPVAEGRPPGCGLGSSALLPSPVSRDS